MHHYLKGCASCVTPFMRLNVLAPPKPFLFHLNHPSHPVAFLWLWLWLWHCPRRLVVRWRLRRHYCQWLRSSFDQRLVGVLHGLQIPGSPSMVVSTGAFMITGLTLLTSLGSSFANSGLDKKAGKIAPTDTRIILHSQGRTVIPSPQDTSYQEKDIQANTAKAFRVWMMAMFIAFSVFLFFRHI